MRIVANFVILALELTLIAGVAWLAFHHAIAFAILTAALILLFGWSLEYARLRHELPFYVAGGTTGGTVRIVLFSLLASGETFIKAIIGGAAALLTFSGNASDRLMLMALVLAATLFLGTSVLRRLSRSFAVHPARWGYFRLAVPLGIAFSLAVQALAALGIVEIKSLAQIANTIVFDLPQKPSLEQLGDFLFNTKQTLDALIQTFLSRLMNPTWAGIVGVIVSLNVLGGAIVAIYAVLISEAVRYLEERWIGVKA